MEKSRYNALGFFFIFYVFFSCKGLVLMVKLRNTTPLQIFNLQQNERISFLLLAREHWPQSHVMWEYVSWLLLSKGVGRKFSREGGGNGKNDWKLVKKYQKNSIICLFRERATKKKSEK